MLHYRLQTLHYTDSRSVYSSSTSTRTWDEVFKQSTLIFLSLSVFICLCCQEFPLLMLNFSISCLLICPTNCSIPCLLICPQNALCGSGRLGARIQTVQRDYENFSLVNSTLKPPHHNIGKQISHRQIVSQTDSVTNRQCYKQTVSQTDRDSWSHCFIVTCSSICNAQTAVSARQD